MKKLFIIITALMMALIPLKAMGVLAWAWWVVFIPVWFPVVYIYIIITIGVFMSWRKGGNYEG